MGVHTRFLSFSVHLAASREGVAATGSRITVSLGCSFWCLSDGNGLLKAARTDIVFLVLLVLLYERPTLE